MNATIGQYNADPSIQSNTTSVISLIKQHNSRRDLSSGQKTILTTLRLACGPRGYVRYRVQKLADLAGFDSISQARAHLSSLVAKGILVRKIVPGRANWWILPDQLSAPPMDRRPLVKEERTNDNVAFKYPKSKTFDMNLVLQIEQVTGDKVGRGCFVKIVRETSPDIVHAALSSLKVAMSSDIVVKPAAYFVQTIKNYCPDVFSSPKTASESLLTHNKQTTTKPKTPKEQYFEPEDIVPAPQEIAKQAISVIKSILDKPRCCISHEVRK